MEGDKNISENALLEPSTTLLKLSPDEDQTDNSNIIISLSESDNALADSESLNEENTEVKIVARVSPEDDCNLPYDSSHHRRNASVDEIVAKIPANYSSVQKSTERLNTCNNIDLSRGQIDTAAPIKSVKAAVSKFGGIVDWKAHRVMTVERRKFIELELEKAQEEMPSYKHQSEAAEEAKTQVLNELESTKRLIEELKLNLERAQIEEQQAKQDSELAKLRVEEMEQGIADEASFAAKAQLEVAQARHAAAVSELKTVNDELEQLKKDYSLLVDEKDAAVKKAEDAISKSKEAEKSVEDLSIEIITLKQALESAHAANMEAEEHRIGAVLAKEQDTLDWEMELKQAENELERLNEQMLSTKDLKSKLDKATSLLCELKAELAAYMESKTGQGVDLESNKTRADIEAAVNAAKKELEEVKVNFEKANNEVSVLKSSATSLKSELERGKMDLSCIREREGMASIKVASLEAEINRTNSEIALVELKENEERAKMVDFPKKLQDADQRAEQAKALVQTARDELEKAKNEAGQAKNEASFMESRLMAARKEIESAKASEKLALAAISALEESESAKTDYQDLTNGITLTLEEYYELSKRAHEAEEEANARVADSMAQIDLAKESESNSLHKLEQASRVLSERKVELEAAMRKAEQAKEEKLGVEMELRKWRAEIEERRKTGESLPLVNTDRPKEMDFVERAYTGSTLIQRSPRAKMGNGEKTSNSENESTNYEKMVIMKKKKKSFFPRIFMFLAKKKLQAKKA